MPTSSLIGLKKMPESQGIRAPELVAAVEEKRERAAKAVEKEAAARVA